MVIISSGVRARPIASNCCTGTPLTIMLIISLSIITLFGLSTSPIVRPLMSKVKYLVMVLNFSCRSLSTPSIVWFVCVNFSVISSDSSFSAASISSLVARPSVTVFETDSSISSRMARIVAFISVVVEYSTRRPSV